MGTMDDEELGIPHVSNSQFPPSIYGGIHLHVGAPNGSGGGSPIGPGGYTVSGNPHLDRARQFRALHQASKGNVSTSQTLHEASALMSLGSMKGGQQSGT
jgi:hypothetical protein